MALSKIILNQNYDLPDNAAQIGEDDDGNFAFILLKDVAFIEEEVPGEPGLRFTMADGRIFYSLRTEKAVAQLNEYLNKLREQGNL